MRIRVTTDPSVPCGYLLTAEDGCTEIVTLDWDFPGLASNLGFVPCCGSGSTDGTIDCPDCGKTASEMITAAAEWLDEHDGESFQDPGYFD